MAYSAKELMETFKTIKTLPHIAIRLTQMFDDSKTTVRDIEEVMSLDPTLVLRVMKLINSAYYGLRRTVDSVSDAIIYLGNDTLRNIIVMAAVKDLFGDEDSERRFSRKRLWFHSAVVGICAQMIFERMFNKKGENAFLCGILHDIGLIIVDQVVPDLFEMYLTKDTYRQLSIVEYEKQEIGTDHYEIGYLLTKEWKLPRDICEGIRGHYSTRHSIVPSSQMGAIQISEYLASKMGYSSMEGENPILPHALKKHVMEQIMDYKVILTDLPEEIAQAKEIYQME